MLHHLKRGACIEPRDGRIRAHDDVHIRIRLEPLPCLVVHTAFVQGVLLRHIRIDDLADDTLVAVQVADLILLDKRPQIAVGVTNPVLVRELLRDDHTVIETVSAHRHLRTTHSLGDARCAHEIRQRHRLAVKRIVPCIPEPI